MEKLLSSPIIQLGFAGFSVIELAILIYMLKMWREDMKDSRLKIKEMGHQTTDILTQVVEKNTEAFVNHRNSLNGLRETIKENTQVLRNINGKS